MAVFLPTLLLVYRTLLGVAKGTNTERGAGGPGRQNKSIVNIQPVVPTHGHKKKKKENVQERNEKRKKAGENTV